MSPDEKVNVATHAVGLLLFIPLAAWLLARAAPGRERAAVIVFDAAWIVLYAASILYHALPPGSPGKAALLVADYGAIFLVIGAGYTPFALLLLPPNRAGTALLLTWAPAVLGLAVEAAAFTSAYRTAFLRGAYILYAVQGWAPLLAYGRRVLRQLSRASLFFLVASGAVYSAGIVFYRWRSLPWHHAYWHVAVVIGCLLNVGGMRVLLTGRGGGAPAAGRSC